MEIQMTNEQIFLSNEFSLQQNAKHALAKQFWGEKVLRKIIGDNFFNGFLALQDLINHRKVVLDNIRAFSTFLPKKLSGELVSAAINLQQGYRKAVMWEKNYEDCLTFTILNPLTAGSYAAGYFINPDGHFDELAWAKRFVTDTNQCTEKRFQFACFYCFEEVIIDLWHTMKTNGQLPSKDVLYNIKYKYSYLVVLWAYHLENRFSELTYGDGNFLTTGFKVAIDGCYEYAARFFWTRCSSIERSICLQKLNFNCLAVGYAGLIYFMYSIIPVEKKRRLMDSSIKHHSRLLDIWSCLLCSQFYEPVLNDILTFPYSIPRYIYVGLLDSLTSEFKEYQIPIYKTIFKVLWNQFSQLGRNVLKGSLSIIRPLAEIKAIDLLETIIQPLVYPEKEKLLKEHPDVAISPLFIFSKGESYDAALRYLLFFLIDRSHITQRISLRVDAVKVLDHIMKEQVFNRCMEESSETEKIEIIKGIESVQGSLEVLDELLEKTEQMYSL